ncbi:MAG: amidohydrolase, partial [Verrucomicrobiales bacterium]
MPSLRERIDADFEFLKSFRHDLHQHPELSYEEMRTSQRVVEELSEIGIVHVSGLAKGTGIVGWLPATKPGGKTIALRADMDALPIHEETGVPYASKA